ncbi:restriction endonuclease subunit S [Micromonospora sp. NPDC047557]|uniref:restriction endonuclease subunit S n=1 Tax=Micromonospora sp. NPDC047557 TaxID=3364250 RepID=UPI0037223D05
MPEVASGEDTVPRHWETRSVAELADARLGLQLTPARSTGGTPYVRAANIVGRVLDISDVNTMDVSASELSTYELKAGDVLVAEASGSAELVGRSAVWQGEVSPCVFQNTVIRVRSSVMEPNFLHMMLEHHRLQGRLADEARGIGIQHLGLRKLRNLEIPVPPPAEQVDIVENLHARLDHLAQARERLNAALVATGLQEDEVLQLALTGELLAGATKSPWRKTTFGKAGELRSGLARSPKNSSGDFMVPYLRVANVYESRIDFDDLRLINLPPDRREAFTLRPGDILLTQGQSPELLGRPALFEGYDGDISFQNHILRYRCSELLDPRFALLVLRHYFRNGVFRDLARGTTNIAHFTLPAFSALPISLPEKDLQRSIADEAHTQLSVLAEERLAVQQSLAGLPGLEKDLYAMAATGNLAEPNEVGGTAASLLQEQEAARQLEQQAQSTARKPVTSRRNSRNERNAGEEDKPLADRLVEVLAGARGGFTMVELLPRLGLDKNSVEDVESLYVAIRSQPAGSIQAGGATENAPIEARPDAPA